MTIYRITKAARYGLRWRTNDADFWLDEHGAWADSVADARRFELGEVIEAAGNAKARLKANGEFGYLDWLVLSREGGGEKSNE